MKDFVFDLDNYRVRKTLHFQLSQTVYPVMERQQHNKSLILDG